ncbi:MAG: hypothetical protein EOO45_18185 [Flavobacterium sp.]|nr:MAG: hypothetical protein EOO45_18185 [Flavobacterium sp.]
MKKLTLITFVLLLLFQKSIAQESFPTLTGKVNISVTKGTFDCDFTLSNIPKIDDYVIRINSGMNILHFKSLKPDDFVIGHDISFKDTLAYETRAYYFPSSNRKDKFLPESVQVRYTGKFPVANDTVSNFSKKDWKGNVAFNGKTVRSDGTQSAWYPVLYDINNDLLHDQVKYDIAITCEDCSTLYVNGSAPVKGTKARFKSDVPQELMLFCGNYDFAFVDDTYILNPDIDVKEIKEFSKLTNTYKQYYEKQLGISYNQPITFINTTPTSIKDGWLFVAYPTIVNIGHGDSGIKSLMGKWLRPFVAHELAHYYFGTYKVLNSELGDMVSEGFAEYMSMLLTRKMIGADVYQKSVDQKIEYMDDFTPLPMSKIRYNSDYRDRQTYVYDYAPLVFCAIEKEIGEKAMWKWMKTILETRTVFTNYNFLLNTLDKSLTDKAKLEVIKSKYLASDNSVENIKKALEGK